MWPIPNKNASLLGPKSVGAKEFERRYREHLAAMPTERRKLFEGDELRPYENFAVMRDLIDTVAALKKEMRQNPSILEVRPGVSTEQVFISVFVRSGVDVPESGLPEFYGGYWVRAITA